MKSEKEYFGEVVILPPNLIDEEAEKLKMEYYKAKGLEENHFYGIEIITTKYKGEQKCITSNLVTDLSETIYPIDDLLNILKNNKVTSLELDEILEDLKCKQQDMIVVKK